MPQPKIVGEFDYKSGKRIELTIKEDRPLLFIKEYKNNKLTKDFFVSFTGIINCCYKKNKR